jgi:hypothetical protein
MQYIGLPNLTSHHSDENGNFRKLLSDNNMMCFEIRDLHNHQHDGKEENKAQHT